MMRGTDAILALALAATTAVWLPACGPAAHPPSPVAAPSNASARDQGVGTIALAPAQIARAGIEVATVEQAAERAFVDAYGSIFDPTALADAVLARAAASVAFEAARRELVRVQALHRGSENASARELESAEALARRTALEAESAEARLASVAGVDLGERSDLVELVRRLVAGSARLARLDVVAGAQVKPPAELEIREALEPGISYLARFLGAAPAVDPALQGRGFYYSIDVAAIPFGTALSARLPAGDSVALSVRVPPQAVVWQRGHAFVFVALEPGRFQARAVEIRELSASEWLATQGLARGETIVVAGAPLLLAPRAPD